MLRACVINHCLVGLLQPSQAAFDMMAGSQLNLYMLV